MTHPHAEVLRAIADGVPLSEFEVALAGRDDDWFNMATYSMRSWFLKDPEEWLVRRKQQTHVVNGFTVPAPMDKEPTIGEQYFSLSTHDVDYYTWVSWENCPCEKLWLKRGLCFETKEAAIANAKAMLKIDPEAA